MATFNFPSQAIVTHLVDKHSFDPAYFITPSFLPVDAASFLQSPTLIEWDVLEPTQGMTRLSALDADPEVVGRRVRKTKTCPPLYFRESMQIGEAELINARKLGSNLERAGEDLVIDAVFSLNRRIDTMIERYNFMALSGQVIADNVTIDYDFETKQTPDVKNTAGYGGYYWTDHTNGAVIDDIYRAVEALDGTGYTSITMIASREVMAMIARNNQVKDLLAGSAYVNQIGTQNLVTMLPQLLGAGIDDIRVSTQYYVDENGNAQPFADKNKLYLIGKAPGQQLGCFASTPNIYSDVQDAKAGRFARVFYHETDPVPRVTITGGIFGAPVLYRPDFCVCMKVAAD